MLKVAVAQCEAVDTLYAVRDVISRCLEQLQGDQPQLGIIYAADEFDHQLMLDEIMACFPQVQLAGCVSAGDMSSDYGFSEDSISLMLVCSDAFQVTTGYGEGVSVAPQQAVQNAMAMAGKTQDSDAQLCLVFADGVVGKQVDIVEHLYNELPENCQVFGGMSGIQRMNHGIVKSAQFCNEELLNDSIVVLLFSGEIKCTYSLCNSWETVGRRAQVTRAEGLSVSQIGEMSALEFYRYYLGPHTRPAIENPLAVYDPGNNHSGFYLRVPTGYNEDSGTISFPAPIPEGAEIQLTESNRDRILTDLQSSVENVQQSFDQKSTFALLFSCDIRKNILGTHASKELSIVDNILSHKIPVIGFYTFGEISPLSHGAKSIVHHCTLVSLFITTTENNDQENRDIKTEAKDQKQKQTITTVDHDVKDHVTFLQKQLHRERFFREQLEINKETNINIFKKINAELNKKNDALKDLHTQVSEARDGLEKRVQERTRELALTNENLQQEINERTRIFKEKQTLESKLQQALKMEAIGTLAGGIAHDFNNILTPILGYTELVSRGLDEHSDSRENLLNVLTAAKRAKELVRQILLFSRKQEQDPQLLQLQHIIKEALKLLRSSLPTTITFQQEIDPDCGYVMAEPTQIHQVLMNLCTNAAHAMEEHGGQLLVTLTQQAIIGKENDIGTEIQSGNYLHLTVSDTGCGMKESIVDRIFEPYFTTKPAGKGTGMGLSMVHGIVKKHNGHIQVSSTPGVGTTFSIFLPILLAAESKNRQHEPIIDLPKGTEHILLVDDEAMIVELYCSILKGLRYRVTGVSNSTEALTLFEASPQLFDLILTDLTMPDLTGEKLSRLILKIRPDIPIILLSGFSSAIFEAELNEIGISKCLDKPVGMKEIAETVRQVLDNRASV